MQACDVLPDNSQAFVSYFFNFIFTTCLNFHVEIVLHFQLLTFV